MAKELMTPLETGKKLREYAEMTARYSQNWDNFEEIATSMLTQAFQEGKRSAYDEASAAGAKV